MSRRPEDRVCFVHVGTHKTGTTALQSCLAANDSVLAEHGLLYPSCGRWRQGADGHHNIATELANDERFDPALGSFGELTAELRASALPMACISSEAFQFIHDIPTQLVRLRDGITSAGFRPVVVVYLRGQCEYLESLYCTLVVHGYAQPFHRYVDEAMETGIIRHKGVRSYRFDYDVLIGHYGASFGPENVIVRPYKPNEDTGWIVRDFLAALGGSTYDSIALAVPAERANVRPGLLPLVHQLLRNAGTDPSAETQRLTRLCEEFQFSKERPLEFRPFEERDIRSVSECFEARNRLVNELWNVLVEVSPTALLNERRALQCDPAERVGRALLHSVESDLSARSARG